MAEGQTGEEKPKITDSMSQEIHSDTRGIRSTWPKLAQIHSGSNAPSEGRQDSSSITQPLKVFYVKHFSSVFELLSLIYGLIDRK